MNGAPREREGWVRKYSRTMEQAVRSLRLQLAFFLVLPSFTALLISWMSGLEVFWTIRLIANLALISCTFAALYDTISQLSEVVYHRWHGGEDGLSFCQSFAQRHDLWRTIRYAGVHLVYNGPYHMPKLVFLNWMYPGTPTPTIALYKWLWATFLFSPGESFGVLSGVQIMRDGGSVSNVCLKLRSDGLQFQITKWVGHAIPHYLSFLSTNDVVGMYVYNFAFKAMFEIILAILAARPVKNKAGRSLYDGVQDSTETQPLSGKQSNKFSTGYDAI